MLLIHDWTQNCTMKCQDHKISSILYLIWKSFSNLDNLLTTFLSNNENLEIKFLKIWSTMFTTGISLGVRAVIVNLLE